MMPIVRDGGLVVIAKTDFAHYVFAAATWLPYKSDAPSSLLGLVARRMGAVLFSSGGATMWDATRQRNLAVPRVQSSAWRAMLAAHDVHERYWSTRLGDEAALMSGLVIELVALRSVLKFCADVQERGL